MNETSSEKAERTKAKKYGFLTKRAENYTREDIEELFSNGEIVSFVYLATNGLSLLDKGLLTEKEINYLFSLENSSPEAWDEWNRARALFKAITEKGDRLFYNLVFYSKLEQKAIRIAVDETRTEYFQLLLNSFIETNKLTKEDIAQRIAFIESNTKLYEGLKSIDVYNLELDKFLKERDLKIIPLTEGTRKNILESEFVCFDIDYSPEEKEIAEEGEIVINNIATIYKAVKDWTRKNKFPHLPSSFLDAEDIIKNFGKIAKEAKKRKTMNLVKQKRTDILPPMDLKAAQIKESLYKYIINELNFENDKPRRPRETH